MINADLYVNGMDKLVMLAEIGVKPSLYRREFIVRINDLAKGAKAAIKTLRRTWHFGQDVGYIRISAKVTRLNLTAPTSTRRPLVGTFAYDPVHNMTKTYDGGITLDIK